MVSQRRSSIEIIADMLKVGESGAGKTRLMYNANLSYSQIQKYLGFLLSHGFINKIEVGNPAATYQVTESGLKLLELIHDLQEMLGIAEKNTV